MKRISTIVAAIVLPLLSVLLLNSCKKDSKDEPRKTFTAEFSIFWRVHPLPSTPVTVNGVKYNVYGNLNGGGNGKVTDLENFKYYFNHFMYDSTVGKLKLLNAPVTDVPSYPIFPQYKTPRIQNGDFKDLIAADNSYHFPSSVQGRIVNSVLFDEKGNAVFTSVLSSEIIATNSNIIAFKGKGVVLGGRGKFNDSKGEFDFHGYFNYDRPDDARYQITNGWIEY